MTTRISAMSNISKFEVNFHVLCLSRLRPIPSPYGEIRICDNSPSLIENGGCGNESMLLSKCTKIAVSNKMPFI